MKPSEYSIIPTEWIDKEMAIYVHCLNELESVPTEKRDELWSSMLSVNRHRVVLLQRIKERLQPLLPVVEDAYEAGKLHEELSQTFFNPKGRFLNQDI